jgi:hypothetical protein
MKTDVLSVVSEEEIHRQFLTEVKTLSSTMERIFTGAQDLTADVNYFTSDPQLTYLGNGVFTMSGPEQVAASTGDPRWLPAE